MKRFTALFLIVGMGAFLTHASIAAPLNYEDYPIIKLRSLDKITARTMNFEAKVGSTIRFGDIFIKIQSCRKPPPIEKNEAAAFLQIYQADESDSVQTETKDDKSQSSWIFSGWMFSSSPAISAMDHPIYDVWVLDCLGRDPEPLPPPEQQVVEQENQETPENKDQNTTDADEKTAPDNTTKSDKTATDLDAPSETNVPKDIETKTNESAPDVVNEQKSDEPSVDEILQPQKATSETGTVSDDAEIFSPAAPVQPSKSDEAPTQNSTPTTEQNISPQELPPEPQPQNQSPNLDGIY